MRLRAEDGCRTRAKAGSVGLSQVRMMKVTFDLKLFFLLHQ